MMEFTAEFGYTLGTGKLFMSMEDFQDSMERLMGRPILTHEFGDKEVWEEARQRFEEDALEKVE